MTTQHARLRISPLCNTLSTGSYRNGGTDPAIPQEQRAKYRIRKAEEAIRARRSGEPSSDVGSRCGLASHLGRTVFDLLEAPSARAAIRLARRISSRGRRTGQQIRGSPLMPTMESRCPVVWQYRRALLPVRPTARRGVAHGVHWLLAFPIRRCAGQHPAIRGPSLER